MSPVYVPFVPSPMPVLMPAVNSAVFVNAADVEACSLPSCSLVCAVSYTSQFGEKLYFRKFFKFQVSYV